nr:4Fe-4S dicluster domain-containing protein [uncultured Dethiosulfovibrio sp.]
MSGKTVRRIIVIDREKCDGCALCAQACHEGAIQMVDGKAELVSDSYCDGLGDCIGECPVGAISFEEREAAPYDEDAVKKHIGACQSCPGTMARSIGHVETVEESSNVAPPPSRLANWPVQLKLVPENAPYLQGSHIVIAADCTAFAHPDFHRVFLGDGKVCLVGCPKLDDSEAYREKIARIISANGSKAVTVVYMEVPCCGGMVRLVEAAIEAAMVDLDYTKVKLALQGDELARESVRYRFSR